MKRALVLDGGGGKAVYTLGVLYELEQYLQLHCSEPRTIHDCFDFFFGTSSGAIICTAIASGMHVKQVYSFYRETLAKVMYYSAISKVTPSVMAKRRSHALSSQLKHVFHDYPFDYINKSLAIYCTDFVKRVPRVFHTDMLLAGASELIFTPGFGATIVEGLLATSAAYPIFERVYVNGRTLQFEAVDGGYYANNPTLFALNSIHKGYPHTTCKLLNIGVGSYIEPPVNQILKKIDMYNLVDLVLESSTKSHNTLVEYLCNESKEVLRINDEVPMTIDFFVHEELDLEGIFTYGRKSFLQHQEEIIDFLEIKIL